MIDDVKKILTTILENPNIDFEISGTYPNVVRYSVHYKSKGDRYYICPSSQSIDAINIFRNGILIKQIKCTQEEYLEVELLLTKIAKLFKDKSYNKFIHSLDENIRNN